MQFYDKPFRKYKKGNIFQLIFRLVYLGTQTQQRWYRKKNAEANLIYKHR